MKNKIIKAIATSLAVLTLAAPFPSYAMEATATETVNINNIYPKMGFVVETDYSTWETEECGLITVEDFNGNLWQFFDVNGDLYINDIVSMIISDESTLEIWDDVILSIQYDGYIGNGISGWERTPENQEMVDFYLSMMNTNE